MRSQPLFIRVGSEGRLDETDADFVEYRMEFTLVLACAY